MRVPASVLLEFTAQFPRLEWERHEIWDDAFSQLRHGLRSLVLELREIDDASAQFICQTASTVLCQILSDPIPFTEDLTSNLVARGAVSQIAEKWGVQAGQAYRNIIEATVDLRSRESRLRLKLGEILADTMLTGRFKIYANRKAAGYYVSAASLLGVELPPVAFLHTPREYRDTRPFPALIKVGPFRARGWGASPDALLSAPRFSKLIQIVWGGCTDAADFGYDPTTVVAAYRQRDSSYPAIHHNIKRFEEGSNSWTQHEATPEDDFHLLRAHNVPRNSRQAILVVFDDDQAVFYPPNSEVLAFDLTEGRGSLRFRVAREELDVGMYVVTQYLDEIDLGGLRAESGVYSKLWKSRLRTAFNFDRGRLLNRLDNAGLKLVHLESAIRHWCEPATSVIPAPQQKRHFEILIQVLDIGYDNTDVAYRPGNWAHHAWSEIRHSRGKAIVAGMHEQSIINEEVVRVVTEMLTPQNLECIHQNTSISLPVPTGHSITGEILFDQIVDIQTGFLVPDDQLKEPITPQGAEQWRV